MLGYALRRTDPEEARDVVAETFTVAWRRLEDVPVGDGALPWLLATARKQLANRRRRDDTRARHGGRSGPLAASDAGGTVSIVRDPADGVAERAALVSAFAQLSEEDRETLALIAWDGLQPREAAVVQGCSAATFAVRAHRARRRLGALLGADDDAAALDAQGGRS